MDQEISGISFWLLSVGIGLGQFKVLLITITVLYCVEFHRAKIAKSKNWFKWRHMQRIYMRSVVPASNFPSSVYTLNINNQDLQVTI